MKTCTKCKVEKPLAQFSFKNIASETYSSECKECHRSVRNSYYRNNAKKEIDRVTSRKDEVRALYKRFKAGLRCARCGEDHPATLHFHHTDPSVKEFVLSAAVARGYSMARISKEAEKCLVLCANCHAKEHFIDAR